MYIYKAFINDLLENLELNTVLSDVSSKQTKSKVSNHFDFYPATVICYQLWINDCLFLWTTQNIIFEIQKN